jgi:hypothetical protein
MATILPVLYFILGKIIKYKVVDSEIAAIAFGTFVLQKVSLHEIVKVDTAHPIFSNPATTFKLGHTRIRWIVNSLTNDRKLIKLKSGRTFLISPERGSEVDLLLFKVNQS